MASLLLVVLGQRQHLPELLEAWQSVGVPGITILRSAGASRARSWLGWIGLRGGEDAIASEAMTQNILLAAIEEEEMLDRAKAEAERVVGGFDRPYSGVMLVLPISAAAGLRGKRPERRPRRLPAAVRPDWIVTRDTTVEAAADILDLEPTLVTPGMPLDEVAQQMVARPTVHVACVVDDAGRLLGLIDIQSLADDLFFHIVPEEFLSEVSDLEEALQYAAKSRIRTAADAMVSPAWIKQGQTVRDAFRRMHEQRLSGLPIVNETYHVVGYVNLLELLAACATGLQAPGDEGAES